MRTWPERKHRGTKDLPWKLTTPSGSSEYEAYRDESLDRPALMVKAGKTELRYQSRCIADLHVALKDSRRLDTVGQRAEGRDGLRGRFTMYVPPVLKELGLAEVEQNPRNIECGLYSSVYAAGGRGLPVLRTG